ncbi:MAG: c-type cytochrome [Planctomyces sp.]|nr:c-type cytochrome [Planctomyces sp.]
MIRTACAACAFMVLLAGVATQSTAHDHAADPPAPNTQAETIPFTSPEDALAALRLPEGFRATLFAAEPQIRQPISMAFDERGRLWVAECDSYSDQTENFSDHTRDRVVILTDADGDGVAETRTVFWGEGRRVTSAVPGLGGVFVLDAPRLLFFRDADRDDVPDGPPEVLLDGFNDREVRHNIVNGLKWGPDGWLYGLHGILATSHVGPPGTAAADRTPINCGVWRFHPLRLTFEVVAHGTTNPWGLDFDQHGQMFMINTVIGHLWHVVPGAHFQRMYGSDFDPYLYRLLPQTADHFHWDTSEVWSDIRNTGVTPTTDLAGGGHAHCGLMIYQGDNWPAEYRNRLYTVNLHGCRINCDVLEREGCGYVGRHGPDVIFTSDPWFRGIELVYGPDGGVYLADWSDIGECHDNDGIHRTSGRIFRIQHGDVDASPAAPVDLRRESDHQLVGWLASSNEWFVRQARLQLQERSTRPQRRNWNGPQLVEQRYRDAATPRQQIAALGTLQAIGAAPAAWIDAELANSRGMDEHTRAWLVRMRSDAVDSGAAAVLTSLAEAEPSGLVRLHLASALQKLPFQERFFLAAALARHAEDADDPWQSLMIWYGIRDAVSTDPERAVELAAGSELPLVREFVIRRVMQKSGPARGAVVATALRLEGPARVSVLRGMVDGLRGVRRTEPPQGWSALQSAGARSDDSDERQLIAELGAVFGDGRALEDLKATALSAAAVAADRRSSIRSLVEARAADLEAFLTALLDDDIVAAEAARGLAAVDSVSVPELLLARYPALAAEARQEAVATLCSRKPWAMRLLAAVDEGSLSRDELSPFQLRQLLLLRDADLSAAVHRLWPDLEHSQQDRTDRIAALREQLSEATLADADLPRGRQLFDNNCGKCHVLFGEGGRIGPDLTGAQRTNLTYLLENIVDPSLTVATTYRMSVVVLTDGRVLNGVVSERTEQSLKLQTATEQLVIPADEIEELQETKLSLMPDGQLDLLSEQDIRDLIGYLMSPSQTPRP